jgi:hypothetical protein
MNGWMGGMGMSTDMALVCFDGFPHMTAYRTAVRISGRLEIFPSKNRIMSCQLLLAFW